MVDGGGAAGWEGGVLVFGDLFSKLAEPVAWGACVLRGAEGLLGVQWGTSSCGWAGWRHEEGPRGPERAGLVGRGGGGPWKASDSHLSASDSHLSASHLPGALGGLESLCCLREQNLEFEQDRLEEAHPAAQPQLWAVEQVC